MQSLAVLESWVEYDSQELFIAVVSAEIEVKFCSKLICSSTIRLWCRVGAVICDITRGTR